MFRLFPGKERCTFYDTRSRPWYVTSATGNKDFIFLLDFSKQSSDGNKELIIKTFSQLFVDSLTYNDFIGAVIIGRNKTLSFNKHLIRANYTNKIKLQTFFNSIASEGDANYYSAFQKAFDILEISRNLKNKSSSTGSQPIILFISNGKSDSTEVFEDLIDFINMRSDSYDPIFKQKRPFIFTFTTEDTTDNNIFKHFSCKVGGIYDNIKTMSQVNPVFVESYLNILIKSHKNTGIKWSDIYDVPWDLGEMASVCIPIYINTNGTSSLLGVIQGTTRIIDITQDPFTLQDFYDYIKESNSDLITEIDLSECEIESLRKNKCGVTGCANNDYLFQIPNKCPAFFNNHHNLFCYDIVDTVPAQYGCCSYNACTGLAMTIGLGYSFGILIIGLIIIFVYYFYFRKNCIKDKIVNQDDESNSEQLRKITKNSKDDHIINTDNFENKNL